jgi:hypothetical protein
MFSILILCSYAYFIDCSFIADANVIKYKAQILSETYISFPPPIFDLFKKKTDAWFELHVK